MVEGKKQVLAPQYFRIVNLPPGLCSEAELRAQLFQQIMPGPDLRLEVHLNREGRPEGHATAFSPATIAQLLSYSGREVLGEVVTVVPVTTAESQPSSLQDLDPAIIAVSPNKVSAGPTYIIRVCTRQRHEPKSKTHKSKQ